MGKPSWGALSPHLKRYGGDYFPYVLVGIAVSNFVTVGLDALARDVRSAQVEGTLEALLSTPTSIYTVLIGNSLWSFLAALVGAMFLLIGGSIFLRIHVTLLLGLITLLVLIMTFLAFLSIGMLSASFIMVFKQGNPIKFIFGSSSYFLGGVLFPIEVLPKPFQAIAVVLPITHAVKALRELLLARVGFHEITPLLLNLAIFIALVAPVSILFFRYAVQRAKKDGSLIQF